MSSIEFVKGVVGAVKVATRPVRTSFDIAKRKYSKDTYFELQVNEAPNGLINELIEVEYPITPESVKSYVEETDYKKNPELLQANSGRKNLGDVTAVQELQSLDMSAMRQEIANLTKKLDEYEKNKQKGKQSEPAPAFVPAPAPVVEGGNQ